MESVIYLPKPKSGSHKGQNGVVLIIGGSCTYHGAPILSALAAMRFCDLVYFSSSPQNAAVLRKMKEATPNVIAIPKPKFGFALSHASSVLVGNGMEVSKATGRMVERILRTKKRCVIDAAALRCLPLRLLHANALLTPHSKEFEACFSCKAGRRNAEAMSKKHSCTILLKGKEDIVAFNGKSLLVKGGNAGMTKGGTGDVLAGLCAALFSTCPSPMRSAYSASLLNKRAGEMLYRIYGYNFCSEDIAEELPFVAASLAHGKGAF